MLRTPFQIFKDKWKDGCGSELCDNASNIVLCKGKLPCDVLFIGEAPGQSEDATGIPFYGPAGKLLEKRIIPASGIDKYRLAFANLVCCIPLGEDGNKIAEPPQEAIKKCAPRLKDFVRLCKPRLIVLVGALSAKNICGQTQFYSTSESNCPWIPEGKFLEFVEITHPAAILRANQAAQGLMEQKCVVALRSAVEDVLEKQ